MHFSSSDISLDYKCCMSDDVQQVRVLLERAHAVSKLWRDAPVVLCGDFNCTPKVIQFMLVFICWQSLFYLFCKTGLVPSLSLNNNCFYLLLNQSPLYNLILDQKVFFDSLVDIA